MQPSKEVVLESSFVAPQQTNLSKHKQNKTKALQIKADGDLPTASPVALLYQEKTNVGIPIPVSSIVDSKVDQGFYEP